MATKNDITGDALVSRGASKAYLDNYDLIFRKEKPQKEKENGSTNRHGTEGKNQEADSSQPVA